MPVADYDLSERRGPPPFDGAIGFRIGREAGIAEARRIVHGSGSGLRSVRRSIVVGDRLYTVSDAGVAAHDLGTFGPLDFVAFDQ